MTLQEWLDKTETNGKSNRPRISCKDGFTISVQASSYHYCSPRSSGYGSGYDEVELGYPNKKLPKSFGEYKDGADMKDTETVFGYVPVSLVAELLQKHGGISE